MVAILPIIMTMQWFGGSVYNGTTMENDVFDFEEHKLLYWFYIVFVMLRIELLILVSVVAWHELKFISSLRDLLFTRNRIIDCINFAL